MIFVVSFDRGGNRQVTLPVRVQAHFRAQTGGHESLITPLDELLDR